MSVLLRFLGFLGVAATTIVAIGTCLYIHAHGDGGWLQIVSPICGLVAVLLARAVAAGLADLPETLHASRPAAVLAPLGAATLAVAGALLFLVRTGNRIGDTNQKRCDSGNRTACREVYCKGGDASDCFALARKWDSGSDGRKKDEARAFLLYRLACDDGYLSACNNLGSMYLDGRGGAAKDEGKAASLYRRACDGGEMYGCSNLAFAFQTGRGVGKDPDGAASLYTRACEGRVGAACVSLGLMYEEGKRSKAPREGKEST